MVIDCVQLDADPLPSRNVHRAIHEADKALKAALRDEGDKTIPDAKFFPFHDFVLGSYKEIDVSVEIHPGAVLFFNELLDVNRGVEYVWTWDRTELPIQCEMIRRRQGFSAALGIIDVDRSEERSSHGVRHVA